MNDIDEHIQKLEQMIKFAERILITSHTSPDPDAVASLLLLGTTLDLNFPNKEVQMVLEEEPEGLDFLVNFDQIKTGPLNEAVMEFKPNIVVIVDANNYERVSRRGAPEIKQFMADSGAKLAILDHHLPDDKEEADFYSNIANPAAVQEVYEICFDELDLKKPEGYAQTAMVGLYSDSGGFAYYNWRYTQTFKLAAELVDAGANIELIKNKLNQYSEDQIRVFGELMGNLTHQDNFTYSTLSDDFVNTWVDSGKSLPALHAARKRFVNDYIRNVEGRTWGFVTSLDPQEGVGCYSVSLRSLSGHIDVNKIAKALGGGGHKAAAGADLKASNLDDALQKIKKAIAEIT